MHSWYLKGRNEVEDLFLCWSSLTVFQHAITCFNEGCKLWARACTFFLLKMEWAQQSSRATTYRDCSSWQQKLKILCATIKTHCTQIDIKKKKKRPGQVPWHLSGKESACLCRRHRFSPWSRKIPHAMGSHMLSLWGTTTEAHTPWSLGSTTEKPLQWENHTSQLEETGARQGRPSTVKNN